GADLAAPGAGVRVPVAARPGPDGEGAEPPRPGGRAGREGRRRPGRAPRGGRAVGPAVRTRPLRPRPRPAQRRRPDGGPPRPQLSGGGGAGMTHPRSRRLACAVLATLAAWAVPAHVGAQEKDPAVAFLE